jgi:hypothetical protein
MELFAIASLAAPVPEQAKCAMTAAAEGRRGPSCCVAVGGIALAGMQGFVALFRQCNRRVNAAGLQPW